MITDKDGEEARVIFESWSDDGLAGIDKCVYRIRIDSADQARKEAADRAVEFIRDQGMEQMEMWGEYDDNRLRAAILGDSVVKENLITDHIPDTGKKLHPEITNDYVKKLEDDLAIAVKALEEIRADACILFGIHHPTLDAGFGPSKDIIQIVDRTTKEIQG